MASDYIKCPRCELNYIHKDEGYCAVCKAELKIGPQLLYAVDDDDYEAEQILCPRCKQNYILENEGLCEQCKEEMRMAEEKDDVDIEKDETWRTFVDDDLDAEPLEGVDEAELLSLSQLAEQEGAELFDDEEEPEEEEEFDREEPDDFEIPPFDEADFEDYDEEEDDDDDEDEDEDDVNEDE